MLRGVPIPCHRQYLSDAIIPTLCVPRLRSTQLYDSVFHGDELDPAKIKIKMRVGNGFVTRSSDDALSDSLLADQEGLRLYDIGGDEVEGMVVDGSLETAETNVMALQQRVLELEEVERQLLATLHEMLSKK